MTRIRIRKVYDGRTCGQTFVNLTQTKKGIVEYSEDYYPTKNATYPFHINVKTITSDEANKIFMELKKYARPYIGHSEDDILSPMKN